MFPTIAEYNHAVLSKGGNAFKTLTNLTFIPSRTVPVKIYNHSSGSYAVVFKAKEENREFAIRCFISAETENIDRYRSINRYLKTLTASWITNIELLEDEINVGNKFYPVIKMDWVDGQTLNKFISQIIDNYSALVDLQREVVRVSKSLEKLNVGHGDIQCGNIIIAKNTSGENIIKLIDYDGMYIPAFSNKASLERGRTEFQHPKRSQIQYNEKIDRFSFWVILCAIEALKYDKTLWFEVMKGGFNTLDNLLFLGDDFNNFNNSKLINRLYALGKPSLNFYLNKLKIFCHSSVDLIEPPYIYETPENPIDTVSYYTNTGGKVDIITTPSGAAVLSSSFEKIGITPLSINKNLYLGKKIIVSYGTKFKQILIEQSTNIVDVYFKETDKSSNTLNSTIPKYSEQIVTETVISPHTPHTPNTPTTPKTDSFRWVNFGIIALIIFSITILLIAINRDSSYSNTSIVAPMVDSVVYVDSQRSQVSDDTTLSALPAAPNLEELPSIGNVSENKVKDHNSSSDKAVLVSGYKPDIVIMIPGKYTFEVSKFDLMLNSRNNLTWEEANKACLLLADGWRLPSKEELAFIYQNKDYIDELTKDHYWSLDSNGDDQAWTQYFGNFTDLYAIQSMQEKKERFRVRAVRFRKL